MFRPPAREMCLNTLEDVYQTCKLILYFTDRIDPFLSFDSYIDLLIHRRRISPCSRKGLVKMETRSYTTSRASRQRHSSSAGRGTDYCA